MVEDTLYYTNIICGYIIIVLPRTFNPTLDIFYMYILSSEL